MSFQELLFLVQSVSLAKDRETPVAASTLTANEIVERIGNLELPELLNSTPGVFATVVVVLLVILE